MLGPDLPRPSRTEARLQEGPEGGQGSGCPAMPLFLFLVGTRWVLSALIPAGPAGGGQSAPWLRPVPWLSGSLARLNSPPTAALPPGRLPTGSGNRHLFSYRCGNGGPRAEGE